MKILMVCNNLSRGGAEKQLSYIINNLYQKHTFNIILLDDLDHKLKYNNIPITYFPIQKSIFHPQSIISIFKFLLYVRKQNAHILHSWLYRPNLITSIIKIFYRKSNFIVSERNTFFWHKKYHFIINKIIYRLCNTILVNSYTLKKEIKKFCKVYKQIKIIPNGIDLKEDIDKLEIPQLIQNLKDKNNIIIGSVGRFVKQKRYNDIIEAAKILFQVKRNIHFVFIGGRGDQKKFQQLIENYHIGNFITHIGEIQNVLPYIKGFDIFLHASSAEGMSNAIMEAMLMGKPIIATDVGGTSDLIDNGVNGILIPPFRPDKIVSAIETLLINKKLQKIFSLNNIKKIQNYSIEKMISNIDQMYIETCDKS